jgi:hypothetical protein
MIEFGRITQVEPPYPIGLATPSEVRRYGHEMRYYNPDIGVVTVFDAEGNDSQEEIGIRLADARFPYVDDEGTIDMLTSSISELVLGVDLVPNVSLKLGEEIVFQRTPGFLDVIIPFKEPKRRIEFAHRAGTWAVASFYRAALHVQEHGRGIPELDDDRY